MKGYGLDAFDRVSQKEVLVGETYLARVSGAIARVLILGESPSRRGRKWYARNLGTGRQIVVSAARLRRPGTARVRETETERAVRLLTEYLSYAPAEVLVHPDPGVPGTYALRAQTRGGLADFLIVDVRRATEADVQEVEFKTWPPEQVPRLQR